MGWTVTNFIALAVIFAFLAIISVVLRFWARTVTKVELGIHDILIIPATLCVIGIAVTMIVGTSIGNMAQHQINELGPQGPIFTDTLRNYEICNYVLQLLPLASLGLSKTSVLCLYRKIFYSHTRFLVVNTILIAIVAAWAVSFFFATLFQCKDPVTLWTSFEYARVDCVDTIPFYYAVSIAGFITDIMILLSPLPVIRKLHMPLKSRIAVAGILLLGAIVCGAGIARFVTFINIGRGIFANINDLTYFTTPVFAWTMIESSLAVVGANLPLLRPLLQRSTYTSSQAWSIFRSWYSKRTLGNSYGSISLQTIGEGSFKPSVQHAKDNSSQEAILAGETAQAKRAEPLDGKILVQKKFEIGVV